ncbi:hypothetical protein [Pseudovibrio sp. Tun.PSC04-5.I4]|nr:hypothetical protein [Pseudovibrio sp. Tun.PSC04-5.I4]
MFRNRWPDAPEYAAPWMMAPVGMIIVSVLAFNAAGDGLRDAMDPYSNA